MYPQANLQLYATERRYLVPSWATNEEKKRDIGRMQGVQLSACATPGSAFVERGVQRVLSSRSVKIAHNVTLPTYLIMKSER